MTKPSIRILAACAALASAAPVLTSTAPARAQAAATQGVAAQTAPSGPADAAALKRARESFELANKLYDANKYPQAEAAYLIAWKIKKSFDVAGNFGNLEADMNKPRNAAEYLAYALREFPAGGKPALRDALIKRLGEVTKLVGVLRLTSSKPGAEMFVDGVSLGVSPLADEVYLEPGTHIIEARLDGFMPAQMTVTAVKGKTDQQELTPLPPPGANKTVLIAGGVLAGVGVLAGGALLGISTTKKGSAADVAAASAMGGCPAGGSGATAGACKNVADALSSRKTLANVGLWTLVGGGVVGVGTLIYGLAGGSKAPRTGVRVLPVVTGDGGGLVVGGSF
jgi:hypothetical protein